MAHKLGLFGGTFDPIHHGHLLMARDALEHHDLVQVLFVPNVQSPLKGGSTLTDAAHRLAMVRLAVAGQPGFGVSDLELNRTGVSYTVDTLRQVHRDYPEHELFFIMGADSLRDLHRWRAVEEILALCKVLVTARPGPADPQALAAEVNLPAALKRQVLAGLETTRQLDISATEIRQRCRDGRSIKYLVPEAVERYIIEHQLYQA